MMRAFEMLLSEDFHYVGNCTDQTTAPHLQDMMDNARQISYRTFVKAVGIENAQELFRDYGWGHQRGDLRMKNDPYVYYYRSKFDGKLCYYVRHSGIEYIFTEGGDGEEKGIEVPIRPNRFSIMGDGAMLNDYIGRSTFHGSKSPGSLNVRCSVAPSAKAAATLSRMIKQSKLETVTMDGEEEDSKELLSWLRKFL